MTFTQCRLKSALALFAGTAALVLACSSVTAAEDRLPPATVRAELVALYEGLDSASYDLFAHRDEATYRQYLRELTRSVDRPQSRQETAILLQRLAAYGRIGHARIDAPVEGFVMRLASGGRLLPVFVRVDDGHVLLTEAADVAGRFSAGDEVLGINGEATTFWLERLGGYVSAERPYMTHTLMEQSFPVLLGFALGDVDSVALTVRRPSGEIITGDLPAVTLAQRREIARTYPTPSFDTDFSTRTFALLPQGIGYLRPGPFSEQAGPRPDAATDYDTTDFKAFIDESFERLLASGASDLIIDLRNNPGGDNTFSDLMVAWFADRPFRFASSFTLKASAQTKAWYAARAEEAAQDETLNALARTEARQVNGARYVYDLPMNAPRPGGRFQGRVHVLVNRNSFSNAASVAAMIQDFDFGEVLGEETADVPTTYASILTFDLPATGIVVTYPKSRIIRPSGDETLIGVTPDRVISRPAIGEITDSVLEEAVRLVEVDRSTSRPALR
jgi:hypothetical protein